jgi:hypothetical protein
MHVTNTPIEDSTAMNHQLSPEQWIAGSARKKVSPSSSMQSKVCSALRVTEG